MPAEKHNFKFRPEDYFKTGRPYEMTMATNTHIFKELTEGRSFVNECGDDACGHFRTTVICDGFTGDNTEVSFIYYDEEMHMTNHFLLSADVLAKSIGLQPNGKLIDSNRDDYVCLTRIPAESWKGGPTEDCFGSISGNVPSFMLEYVIQKNDDDITGDEYEIGKAYYIKAGRVIPGYSIQDRSVICGCVGIFIGYDENKFARFFVAYGNDFAQAIEMKFEFSRDYIRQWELSITEMPMINHVETIENPTENNHEYVICNNGNVVNLPIKKYTFRHDKDDEPYFVPGMPYVLACIQDGEFYQRIKTQAIARCELGETDAVDNMLTELREFTQNPDGSYERVPGWCTLTIATFKEFTDDYTRAWFYVSMYGKMCTFYITADEVMRNIDENAWTFHHDDKKKMGELFWLIKLDRLPALYNMTFINTLGSSGIYDSIVCPSHVIKTHCAKFDTNLFKFGHAYWIQSDYYKEMQCDVKDTIALAVGSGVIALFIGYDEHDTYARFIFVLNGAGEDSEVPAMTCTANYTLEKLKKDKINITHISPDNAKHLIDFCKSRIEEVK